MLSKFAVGVLALLAVYGAARAEVVGKSARLAGMTVDYKVSLPPGYAPDKAYPLILVFTGGDQTLQAAASTLEQDWRVEADKRGYIVVSPAAPDGALFFQDGDRVFPAFLDLLRKDYRIAGRIHIAGHSNGGLSAFHLAARYPDAFSTVTGYPGLYEEDAKGSLRALRPLCVYMHAGSLDQEWSTAMHDQYDQLKSEGYRIRFTLEQGQPHRIKLPDLSRRLFDEIESCR